MDFWRKDVVKIRKDMLVSLNDSLLNVGGGRLVLVTVVVSEQNEPASSITIDHALNGEAMGKRAFQASETRRGQIDHGVRMSSHMESRLERERESDMNRRKSGTAWMCDIESGEKSTHPEHP